MSNKDWIKGGQSPNPAGRPKKKRSSPTIARMIERFVMRNVSPRKLQKLFEGLKPNEQAMFLSDLLPYAISKKPTQAQIGIGQLSDAQLQQLHDQVIGAIDVFDIPEDIEHEEMKLLQNGTEG